MSWGFEKGRTYNRREDIHARFRGQQQGGIITPANHSIVIIITGEAGQAHGYSDRWRADGVFEYFGEGQKGAMEFFRGNAAILHHWVNGKDLLLFSKSKNGLTFEGAFICEGHHTERAPDTQGNTRDAIVFELRPLEAVIEACESSSATEVHGALSDLRSRAFEAAKISPGRSAQTINAVDRSRVVRDYILLRAKGKCEDCGTNAPFVTSDGVPFLEVHHIRRLTDGGPDDPRFMIGVCPNCHRRAHYGVDATERNNEMLEYVTLIEDAIEKGEKV